MSADSMESYTSYIRLVRRHKLTPLDPKLAEFLNFFVPKNILLKIRRLARLDHVPFVGYSCRVALSAYAKTSC